MMESNLDGSEYSDGDTMEPMDGDYSSADFETGVSDESMDAAIDGDYTDFSEDFSDEDFTEDGSEDLLMRALMSLDSMVLMIRRPQMILELKGIYKDYQQGKMIVPVLKDVNFSMEEGEYVASWALLVLVNLH